MSRIKRLKMKGFKSFANPTVLNFENGFNTIVGANGSGKSNVFDAMCFVLGRMSSKGLRADKLGNLVFNGGKTTKPSKEAEVAIYLSNDERELLNVELDEIKISRVVSKKGNSNYYLNNNKATRTQIVEILKRAYIDPDGYNIILQGDIMRIVNMTTIQRRELIEEIANISNYEEKRQKSLQKLEKVETSLKEADLLLEEKTKYIKDLKSEKDAAERFHSVKDDLRYNNLLLVKAKLVRNANLKKIKQEKIESENEQLKIYKDKLEKFEEEEKEIDKSINELEKSIEIKSHNDFISVTNKITAIESQIQNLKEKKAEYTKQKSEISTKTQGIKENIKTNNEKIKNIDLENKKIENNKKEIEKQLLEVESKLNIKKKKISSTSFDKIDLIDKKIDELNEKKYNKNQIKQDNFVQIEKLNTKIEHLEEDLKEIEQNSAQNKDQVKELDNNRKKLKKLITKISQLTSNNSQINANLASLNHEFSSLVEEHSKLKMKSQSSKDLMATNKAVDSILKLQNKDPNIHGSISQLASVTPKYSMALETIAGKSLFNIVVENDNTAVKYINYLKSNKIGNCTFLPLNKINAKFQLDDSVLNKKGVIDYALNLVKYDKKYENVFHLIFQNTLVIENIEYAKGVGIGSYKMVTLEGDLVLKSGAMSGGFKARRNSLGAFKDDKTDERLNHVENKINTLKNTLDHLRDEKESSEEELYNTRQEKAELEGDISKLEKLLSIEGKDTSSIKKDIEIILGDKSIINNSLKKIDSQIKELDKEIEKLQIQKTKLKGDSSGDKQFNEISQLEEKRDKLKENLRKVNSITDGNNIQIKNVLKPEILNLEKIQKDSLSSKDKLNEQINNLTKQIKELEYELKINKSKEKELSKDYKEFISQRDKLKENKKKIEEKYEKEYEKFDKIKEKIAQLNYAISEYNTLNNNLNEELELLYENLKVEFVESGGDDNEGEDKYDEKKIVELLEKVDKALENKNIDIKELQNKVNNLKTKLNSFGAINMKAVKIYDKLNEEFNLLLDKRKELTSERIEILKLVDEMDIKKKEKFMTTFNQLKENFQRIFAKLSTKGKAELHLEDEKDLFNNGVEIKVRMTQKNYLDIKSLSGGEKTITAIAFIFAVQEFNPASFYIFDEVDAALDILNAEKLGKLINNYSRNAQYIVVSHNEYLIQSSDVIYGVTMNDYKISDVVSLDLRDMKDYIDSDEST
ncbi:MAG: chromosome segregation protein SMC [Nanoarchaeota archaeon]